MKYEKRIASKWKTIGLLIIAMIMLLVLAKKLEDGDLLTKRQSKDAGDQYSEIKIIEKEKDAQLLTNVPYWTVQGGCYAEDGIYVIGYASTIDDYSILKLFDMSRNIFIREVIVENLGHVNAICFRPEDRNLYVASRTMQGAENRISVIDYDNLDGGVTRIIETPNPEAIYSITYNPQTDTFYSSSTEKEGERERTLIVSYEGIFESVVDKILIDDVVNDPSYCSQGVQLVVDDIAYILYVEPQMLFVGYNIFTGENVMAYSFPNKLSDYDIIEPESIMYNYEEKKLVVNTLHLIITFPLPETNDANGDLKSDIPTLSECSVVAEIPQYWALCGCYVENGFYIVGYVSTAGDHLILRCYDNKNDLWLWLKSVEGAGYANSICYRPQDRRLYIADSYTYAVSGKLKNTISVLEYDNIDKGVIEIIESPARGGIYSIAYDIENDTFYSTNYLGVVDGEANVLFSYIGIFESVKNEIILDDLTVKYNTHYSQLGVQCVQNSTAWITYYSPDKVIASYDVETGEFKCAYKLPVKTNNDITIGEPETVIYNTDEEIYVMQTASNMVICSF